MISQWTFLCGLTLVIGVSFMALRHLQSPMLQILTDLCGTEGRARFWLAFSNVTLLAIPVIMALHRPPFPGPASRAIYEIADQLQGGLIGLVISLVVLGFVLSRFISHRTTHGGSQHEIL